MLEGCSRATGGKRETAAPLHCAALAEQLRGWWVNGYATTRQRDGGALAARPRSVAVVAARGRSGGSPTRSLERRANNFQGLIREPGAELNRLGSPWCSGTAGPGRPNYRDQIHIMLDS